MIEFTRIVQSFLNMFTVLSVSFMLVPSTVIVLVRKEDSDTSKNDVAG